MTNATISQIWEGKNMFCCRGRCIGGPKADIPVQICVYTFIFGAGGLYYGLLARYMIVNLTVWLPITFSITYFCLLVAFIGTGWSDPGIIPRRKYFEIAPDSIIRKGQEKYLLTPSSLSYQD